MRLTTRSALALTLLTLAGCGSGEVDHGPTGTITGRLTMGGKPLHEGTHAVFMQPEKGFLAFGTTDAEGNFTVDSWNDGQMPIGQYKVMVQPHAAPADDSDPANAEDQINNPEKYSVDLTAIQIPAKYRETSTSGLSYDVKEGPNEFTIDLEPGPATP